MKFELLERAKPYHAKRFPIPKIHEETLNIEANRLIKIGILKRKNNSELAVPTFKIPKRNGTVYFVGTYIDDFLIISNKSFEDHINKLDKVLSKLNQKGFRKVLFARYELKYLGFKISRQDIMPLPDKVEAIKNIAILTTKKQ